MEPRKKAKLTPKMRKWVIRQWEAGITPLAEIVRDRRLPQSSVYLLIERFKRYGWGGLEPRRRGRKEEFVNVNFEQYVLKLWADLPRGSHKLWLDLREQGFSVSQRKIQKIYKYYKLKMNKRTRPSQIKFVKYEWPKPNALWHTDWTVCPFTGKQLIAFIDDHSRFVPHAEYFENATTENTILAFQNAINKHGKPENILTDNGVQFHIQGPFEEFCKEHDIKHILGRIHHPQTNGKIERWFGTYKQEFQPQRWTLNEFVKIYNEERLHQGIGYKVPLERYKIPNNSV